MTNTSSSQEQLVQKAAQELNPEATMAEAGRQILLREFIRMRSQEDGVREDKDIEYIHDMRVATRRQRSAFRLLGSYYKSKPVRPLIQNLKELAGALGDVRDLDVMIADLRKAQKNYVSQDSHDPSGFDDMISDLEKKRRKYLRKLLALLSSKGYRRFLEDYTAFLTQEGSAAKSIDTETVTPSKVRHILPGLLHDHLATVRAYDDVISEDIETVEDATLHALRIEFKRLRYATDFFSDVLGASGDEFIKEIKGIQNHLGRMNDIHVAEMQLTSYLDSIDEEDAEDEEATGGSSMLQLYLDDLEKEHAALKGEFPAVWKHFNSRSVQRKLSDALLVLR
jgi:triphosphatase